MAISAMVSNNSNLLSQVQEIVKDISDFTRFLEDLASAQGCDSLMWIKLLQGLAMGVQCFLGEAPFLFLSGCLFGEIVFNFRFL